ncbi:50S ribosomal protein L25 [Mucisphaera calidilacus]|uniref:Large ribosomal subunit protein bL25 n=1 Tax=Mucisphaera calidilacus TaxID=2527982 RepID=A0A518BV38_9BACT|nr:50S ribosomal protein L25 [Mucisphaera calidilacus]QDU70852.1 50S ribosomal protein L25 [Mucisphaera calidilacus]
MSHDIPTINAEQRTKLGTRYSQRLREDGKIPVVLYGHGQEPLHLAVEQKPLFDAVVSHAHLIDLDVAGKTETALIKDIQWDYLSRHLIHADLTRVDRSERVEVEVGIEFTGDPKALQQAGAVMDHPLQTLSIACRADAIPETIIVPIDELTSDTPVHASAATIPDGVELLTPGDTVLASVSITQAVEDEELETPGGDEPEVINKGKEEDDAE